MYSKIEVRPPPIVSFKGKHIFNNPTGKGICQCSHCGWEFEWDGWEWNRVYISTTNV